LDIQICSTQQGCDVILGQTGNIEFNLNYSSCLIQRDLPNPAYFVDAIEREHLTFSWQHPISESHIDKRHEQPIRELDGYSRHDQNGSLLFQAKSRFFLFPVPAAFGKLFTPGHSEDPG
jgi:hypothetical protein